MERLGKTTSTIIYTRISTVMCCPFNSCGLDWFLPVRGPLKGCPTYKTPPVQRKMNVNTRFPLRFQLDWMWMWRGEARCNWTYSDSNYIWKSIKSAALACFCSQRLRELTPVRRSKGLWCGRLSGSWLSTEHKWSFAQHHSGFFCRWAAFLFSA